MSLALVACFHGGAQAQILGRYYPASVPAYQDWTAGNATNTLDASYRPLGISVGDFVVRPDITESFGDDSDIIGTAGGRGSAEVKNAADLAVNSDWARDAVDLSLSVDDVRVLQDPQRSYTDWTASAGGVIDIGEDRVQVGYLHVNSVTLPSDVGTFNIAAPIVDVIDDLRVSDTIGAGRLTFVPALIGQIYRFDPLFSGPLSTSAATQFNRDAGTGSLTIGYGFAGGHNLLMILSDSHVTYQSGGGLPDYDDASVLVGVQYRLSGLFSYRALVGYEKRFQASVSGQGGIAAPTAELDLIYTPTALTSLTAQISQSLQNEPTGPAQGLTETSATLTLDDQIRRNIRLELSGGYERAAFPGGGEAQSSISGSAQATWFFNRRFSLSVVENFSRNDGTGQSNLRFSRNTIFLQARFQL